jgi:hypothetical protein
MKKIEGITIPFEAFDCIVVEALVMQRKLLKKDLKDHLKKGAYMHPEDLENSHKYISAMDLLIKYYGGVQHD